jgi:hypothetical protein
MRKSVDVRHWGEAEALDKAWADPEMRAAILAFGNLLLVPHADRSKAVRYVCDLLDGPRPLNLQQALDAEARAGEGEGT